jgi:hypothetical protein
MATNKTEDFWSCKLGPADGTKLPDGADFPLRQAVEKAFFELTGKWPEIHWSGWGATLDEVETFGLLQTRERRAAVAGLAKAQSND